MQESDLQTARPTPVCLVDGTKVLFRSTEPCQASALAIPEIEAVFRMLTAPKRDSFQFSDGREIDANALPANLLFDVLEIPGKEEFSSILNGQGDRTELPVATPKSESLLERVLALF